MSSFSFSDAVKETLAPSGGSFASEVEESLSGKSQIAPQDPKEIDAFESSFGDEQGITRPTGQINIPKSGDLSTTAPDSGFTQDELLKASGLGTNEAPAMARFEINMGLGNLSGVKNALERAHDGPVEVKKDELFGLVFKPQGEKEFRPVNRDDVSAGDFAAALPEIGQTVAEVMAATGAAAVTGFGPQSIPPALLAEGAAAYLTEIGRLQIANDQLGQPISDSDMHKSAALRSGLTAAGGIAGSLMQRLFRRVTGRELPSDIQRANLELGTRSKENIAEGREFESSFNELIGGTGKRGRYTLGEASKDGAILEGEEASKKLSFASPVFELEKQNDAAVQTALDRTFGREATEASQDELAGAAVQSSAQRRINEEAATAAEQTQSGVERAVQAERGLFNDLPSFQESTGKSRALIASAKKELETPLKNERDRIISEHGGLPISLTNTRQAGLQLTRQMTKSNFKSLQQETRQVIDEAREAGVTIKSVFTPDSNGNYTKIKKTPATVEEVLNDVSNINDALRRGDLTPKQRRVLNQVSTALRRDLSTGLRQLKPEALREILANNAQFRNLKTQYERGIVGKILKERPNTEGGGGFAMKDERVVPNLVNNLTDAQEVVSILERGGNAGPQALNHVRTATLDYLFENPNSFKRRSKSYEAILSKEQFDSVRDARSKKDAVSALRSAEKETLIRLNKTTDAKLAKMGDISNLVGQLMTPGNLTGFKRARSILAKEQPERLAEFDGAVKRFVMDTLSPDGSPPTPQTIDKILKPAQGQNIQSHLREVFGNDYLKNLRTVRNFQSRRRGVLRESNEVQGAKDLATVFGSGAPALTGIFRFGRVAAPPLSVRGRVLTAITGLGRENAQRALVNAFTDPKKVEALARLGRASFGSKFASQQLGVLGMNYIDDIREALDSVTPGAVLEDSE